MFASMYPLLRSVLFQCDPEWTHDLTINSLKALQRTPLEFLLKQRRVDDPIECFGIQFPNRIGLAAGLDKNGECIDAFGAMGFGHVEVGTVTPRPQPGNDKPRLFRLKEAQGIINRFGFNNRGVDYLLDNVAKSRFDGVIGINIGKNFDTPVENAEQDYLICLNKVYSQAHYITVNISSPNTPNLRKLQFGEALDSLLKTVMQRKIELAEKWQKSVPILVKIAPDMNDAEIEQVADTFVRHGVDGVIATNTTASRDGVEGMRFATEAGGLSGKPLTAMSNLVLHKLSTALKKQIPLIGVGGVIDGDTAGQKIEAGASLVQIYSGFIYRGPKLITEAAEAIKLMKS